MTSRWVRGTGAQSDGLSCARPSARHPRCPRMDNDYNLNISRYVSTALEEAEIDLAATHAELVRIEGEIRTVTAKHNEFLKELGLPPLP